MKRHTMIAVAGALLLSALTNGGMQAAVLFSGTGSGITLRDDFTGTVGASITPTNSILVTQLGYWDQDSLGLAIAHQVGIWTDGGALLGSVTVQTGTASPLTGQYRYEILTTPITLTNGITYRLGAEVISASGDAWLEKGAGDYTVGAPVIINLRAYNGGPGLTFPINTPVGTGGAYIAPNFIGEVLVPEPATLVLVAMGGLLVRQRRKQVRR